MLTDHFKQYAYLMRLDKPIGTLLLLWPTYWALWIASAGIPSIKLIIIFSLGTFLMRSAGCVINDYADRDIDKLVLRTKNRPITAGQVSSKEALCLFIILSLLALLCLIPLNILVKELSIIAFFLAATYPFMKRFFAFPQLYLGFAFSFGIILAFAEINSSISITAVLLYLANIFWTLAYDTVYAISDKPDDLKINIHSSAISLGKYDVLGVMVFYVIFIILLLIIGWLENLSGSYWFAVLIVACLITRQYFRINTRDRESCFQAFLENKWFGLIIFLGILFNYINLAN